MYRREAGEQILVNFNFVDKSRNYGIPGPIWVLSKWKMVLVLVEVRSGTHVGLGRWLIVRCSRDMQSKCGSASEVIESWQSRILIGTHTICTEKVWLCKLSEEWQTIVLDWCAELECGSSGSFWCSNKRNWVSGVDEDGFRIRTQTIRAQNASDPF